MLSLPLSQTQSTENSNHSDAIAALQERFGKQLSVNSTVREQHGHTMTWLANQPPDTVLTVQNKQRGRRGSQDLQSV